MLKLFQFIMPQGLYFGSRYLKRKWHQSKSYLRIFHPHKYSVLSKNIEFKAKHKGERVFILGTGHSIKNIDLTLLKNENKIFLSQFYHHKDYAAVNPQYHIFNELGGHPTIPLEVFYNHYKQIDKKIPNGVSLFFRYQYDYDFIKQHNFFKNKRVYHIEYDSCFSYLLKDGLDATKYFYHPAGCALIALQLAIYMGFSEIYLLGLDFKYYSEKDGQTYFYDRKLSVIDNFVYGPEKSLDDIKNEMLNENLSSFCQKAKVRIECLFQYEQIKKFCEIRNIKIYNLSNRSYLDTYPFLDIQKLKFDTTP